MTSDSDLADCLLSIVIVFSVILGMYVQVLHVGIVNICIVNQNGCYYWIIKILWAVYWLQLVENAFCFSVSPPDLCVCAMSALQWVMAAVKWWKSICSISSCHVKHSAPALCTLWQLLVLFLLFQSHSWRSCEIKKLFHDSFNSIQWLINNNTVALHWWNWWQTTNLFVSFNVQLLMFLVVLLQKYRRDLIGQFYLTPPIMK